MSPAEQLGWACAPPAVTVRHDTRQAHTPRAESTHSCARFPWGSLSSKEALRNPRAQGARALTAGTRSSPWPGHQDPCRPCGVAMSKESKKFKASFGSKNPKPMTVVLD